MKDSDPIIILNTIRLYKIEESTEGKNEIFFLPCGNCQYNRNIYKDILHNFDSLSHKSKEKKSVLL